MLTEVVDERESGLTPRQREIVESIAAKHRAGGFPVVRELTRELGVGSTGLDESLTRLQNKGYLRVENGGRGRGRIIALTDKGKATVQMPGFKIVGCIAAGVPTHAAEDEIVQYIQSLDDLFPHRKPDDIGMTVKGYSMADELLPGDIVLIRPGAEPIDGDVCAVYTGEDYCSTLKRVKFSNNRRTITLEPKNPDFKKMTLPSREVTIVGVAQNMIRPSFRRTD